MTHPSIYKRDIPSFDIIMEARPLTLLRPNPNRPASAAVGEVFVALSLSASPSLWHSAATCSVLQCVAVCCSVLQCVAGCYRVLQGVAMHCRYDFRVGQFVAQRGPLQCVARVAAHCVAQRHHLQFVAVCCRQCVAVCCRPCVAMCCNVLRYVASTLFVRLSMWTGTAICSVLQCVAVYCSALQCVAVCCSVLQCVAQCCNVLQRVAMFCSALQCVAERCSALQCVAVCCSVM